MVKAGGRSHQHSLNHIAWGQHYQGNVTHTYHQAGILPVPVSKEGDKLSLNTTSKPSLEDTRKSKARVGWTRLLRGI